VSVAARAGLDLIGGRDPHRSAERAAEVLGTLRGLAAKVGQMASYVECVVPEQHRGSLASIQCWRGSTWMSSTQQSKPNS